MAIDAGKPALIEKPLTLNATHAGEVVTAVRNRGVFAMEAVWMRSNPLILGTRSRRPGRHRGRRGSSRRLLHPARLQPETPPVRPGQRRRGPTRPRRLPHALRLAVPRPPRYPASPRYALAHRLRCHGRAAMGIRLGSHRAVALRVHCVDTRVGHGRWNRGSISVGPRFLDPTRFVVTTSEGGSRIKRPYTAYGPQIEEVERCLREGLREPVGSPCRYDRDSRID